MNNMVRNKHFNPKTSVHKNGIYYFFKGWSLAFKPGIKRFVFLPMVANIVIMSALFYWLFSSIFHVINAVLLILPSWLHWISHLFTMLIILTMAILFCYFFSAIMNIIAAPFNGLLAEKVESQLTGVAAPNLSWLNLIADLPRIFYRELQKLGNYLLLAVPLLLTFFIPIVGQIVTPIIWFLFSAWWVNVQYADYAFDNHKISFHNMKRLLRQDKIDNLQFGSLVTIFTLLPLLNLIIMPIAVCGATAMWVDRYRKQAILADINVNK